MRIIEPFIEIPDVNGPQILRNIENAGRVCYKSEDSITEASYKEFISRIIARGHESVLEHEKVTVKFVCDRGVTHEIVRHRIASYSQESTRYCNYGAKEEGITVIEPFFFIGKPNYTSWYNACQFAEDIYLSIVRLGATPQEARSVLPNSLKTEIVVTYNLREWRHFFRLRAAKTAHPQMQQLAIPLLLKFKEILHPAFDDIEYNKDFFQENYAAIKEDNNAKDNGVCFL